MLVQSLKRTIQTMAPAVPSASASLVLLAPLSKPRAGYNFEVRMKRDSLNLISSRLQVLMLKRSSKASAFSAAHVFPGGNVDKADSLDAWADVLSVIRRRTTATSQTGAGPVPSTMKHGRARSAAFERRSKKAG
jgi:hypothetical protein